MWAPNLRGVDVLCPRPGGLNGTPSCLSRGQGCLTESCLWQIEFPNSVLLRLRRLIFCPSITLHTAMHRMGAQEPSKVLSWLKLHKKQQRSTPRRCQEKHRGYQVSTPRLSPSPFPLMTPGPLVGLCWAVPQTSRFKYSLKGLWPLVQMLGLPFPGSVTLESKWFAFSGPQFPHV